MSRAEAEWIVLHGRVGKPGRYVDGRPTHLAKGRNPVTGRWLQVAFFYRDDDEIDYEKLGAEHDYDDDTVYVIHAREIERHER